MHDYQGTLSAINELQERSSRGRPPLLWVGAGCSRWAGVPDWKALAEALHSGFVRRAPKYDRKRGLDLLSAGTFASLFSQCKESAPRLYFELLSAQLSPTQPASPVLLRFMNLLRQVAPLQLVTTNVDEILEKHLPRVPTFSYEEIEIAEAAYREERSFICKLHGSASRITSSIWTNEDYQRLVVTPGYLSALSSLIRAGNVLFLGYSIRDKYVLDVLDSNSRERPVLGDGPHFFVNPSHPELLPESVRVIQYDLEPQVDHRAALRVLDVVRVSSSRKAVTIPGTPKFRKSALYLPEYIPPGTIQSSQTVQFGDTKDGATVGKAILGNGFVDSEVPHAITTSLHDLMVGLLCFDSVYLPTHSIARLYLDLGETLFWRLLESDALSFVWLQSEIALVFPGNSAVTGGSFANMSLMNSDTPGDVATLEHAILRQIHPTQPNPSLERRIVDGIRRVTVSPDADLSAAVPSLTSTALLYPQLRDALGMGGGVLPTNIPEWFAFPALRVAHVVRSAEVCRSLGLLSSRVPFGSGALLNATYGLVAAPENASAVASYVVSGKINANLGFLVLKSPEMVDRFLAFRQSHAGQALRVEIAARLERNEGHEFEAAIDSALREALPLRVLSEARTAFVDVQLAPHATATLTTPVTDMTSFERWRMRSGEILRQHCEKYRIGPYDPCPCGSGDKLRFCCGVLLKPPR